MNVEFIVTIIFIILLKSRGTESIYFKDYSNSHDYNGFRSSDDNYRSSLRITGGNTAKLGAIPYQVSFKAAHGRFYTTYCGGTTIKADIILSAAHCFHDDAYLNSKDYAHAGSINVMAIGPRSDSVANGQWRLVIAVSEHKKYRFPHNDIALVKINEPFVFNKYIQPIPYATIDQDYKGKCMASGYGFTSWKTKQLPTHLQYVMVDLQPRKQCNVYGAKTKYFVCPETNILGIGKGDSGGPLVCYDTSDPNDNGTGVVVGVASGRLMNYKLDFYTRVSSFGRFIRAEDFTPINRNRSRDFSGLTGSAMGFGVIMLLLTVIAAIYHFTVSKAVKV